MTAPEQDVRSVLEADRAETLRRIDELGSDVRAIVDAASGVATDDEHDPEGATIAFERAQAQALLAQARDHLAELDAALDRLAAGRYGHCERCGRPIPPERLAARPVARTCTTCVRR